MKLPALKTKTAAVLGCGGLGCSLIAHLAGEGIGTLKLCDCDTVEETNLDRQFLYGEKNLGQEKTAAAAAFLADYAPGTVAVPVQKRIETPEDLAFAKGCDLVCAAADNNAVRAAAAAFCAREQIPLISAGVNERYGSAYLWIPGKSPCPACAGLLEKETGTVVSHSAAVGLVGALAAELGIRCLTEPAFAGDGVLYLYDDTELHKLKIRRRQTCRVCGNQKKELNRDG